MKVKYKKITFNLPFGGYGTFVQKQINVDGEWHTLQQKNFETSDNPYFWNEVSGRDMWEGNYE